MADNSTRLIISIETLLKGLDKTLKGLDAVDRKLKSVGKTPASTAAVDKSIARNVQLRQRAEKAEERASIQSFQRRLNSLALAEKQRTQVIEREGRRRAVIERNTEQQNLRDFQQRINRINTAERQRTQFAAQQAATRVRVERTAEQQNLRDFTARVRRLDRAEQVRIRAERATFAAAPQADAHVQAFRRIERANLAAGEAAAAANARFQSLGNSLRSIGQGATTLGFGLTAALTVPLVAFGRASLDAAVTIDSLKRGLTAIVGSVSEAGTQLQRLTEIAKLPGIGFEEAIQGSVRLQAVGFSAADAEKALIQFSNAVALTGGGREELSRITVQLGQLAAKGKVLSQDLRPIIEAAPAVGRALKAAFGTVNADDIAELTGSSQEFFNVLVKELEKLPRAAAGARNTFENFRDTVFRASAAIGDALIPVLSRLIEFIEPIIIKLADGFSKLPPVLQTIAVLGGASAAAIGPLLIGLGLLTTGVGRLTVGLAQLSTAGLLPTIASLRAFNVTATATIARLLGLRAATVAAAGPWVALAAAIGAVVAVIALSDSDELTAATEDQLKSTKKLVDGYEDELRLLNSLKGEVAATAAEQKRLDSIYKSLGIQAELRIKGIEGEANQLAALRVELTKLLEAEKERLRIQGASIAGKFAQDLQKLNDLQAERLEIEKALTRIAQGGAAPQQPGPLRSNEQVAQQLIARHTELNNKLIEQQELVRNGAAGLKVYEEVSGDSADSAFKLTRTLGGLEGVTADVTRGFKQFTQAQRDGVADIDAVTKALERQRKEQLALDEIEKVIKDRQTLIKDSVTIAREASDSLEGALKFMNAFIAAQPKLRAAIAKEASLAGKTFEEFVKDAVGLKDDKSGSGLRNAQEALADATAKVSQESAEKQIAIKKSENDELLRLNDERFSRELISYQEFIGRRSSLQRAELEGEIKRQKALAQVAADDAARAAARAGVTSGAERTRALAAEQASKAKQIEAEIKILDLQSRQKDIAAETRNELQQFNKERLRNFRELSRELDEILGKEKAAGEAAIDERFRDTLIELNNEMALAQRILADATRDMDAARITAARLSREQIRSQRTSIENHITELKAVNSLRAAQEDIARAEEKQTNLEKELAFQVEFRGINERFALQKRLEGEKLVRAEIIKQQAVIQGVIDSLKRAGLEVPQQLIAGLERFKVAAKGLGELTFTEQFKEAEEDLGRVADVLADKIANVERAIRSRTISELEGRVIIRRLNGEYVGELERQLEVLKAIAAASGDEALQRQARSAEQSVKDTRAAADELENFNAQLKSVAIDSFGDSLSQLFKDLRDNTESAAQDILNFFNNILNRVNDFIAENLAQRIAESLFPDPNAPKGEGGIVGFFKDIFGFGGSGEQQVTAANTTATDANTEALNNLTTTFGGQTAGSGLGSLFGGAVSSLFGGGGGAGGDEGGFLHELGNVVSGLGINVGGVLGASAAAGSTVIDALNINSDWLAKVADALQQNTQALGSESGGGLQGLAALFGGGEAATGDIVTAAPRGRMVRVAEAGYDEAILTTDPKHSMRQAAILRQFLKQTRGLYGRFREIPEMAAGGIISARDAEANLLASMPLRSSLASLVPTAGLSSGSSTPSVNFRNINLLDRREMVRGHLRSAEGAHDILNVISENADEIGRRIRIR